MLYGELSVMCRQLASAMPRRAFMPEREMHKPAHKTAEVWISRDPSAPVPPALHAHHPTMHRLRADPAAGSHPGWEGPMIRCIP